jgi:hypothetical protein
MPRELANENAHLASTDEGDLAVAAGATSVRSSSAKRRASWIMPAMAAVTLGLAACVLWFAGQRHGDRRHGQPPLKGGDAAWGFAKAAPEPATAGVPYSFSQNVKPVESLRYDTLHGLVEQRTNLNFTNVSFIEPGTGDLLELTLPELVIEIFPIYDSRPAEPTGTGAGKRAPGESDAAPPAAKLPEEG